MPITDIVTDDEKAARRALASALRSLDNAAAGNDIDRNTHLAQAHLLATSAVQGLSRWSRLVDLYRERNRLLRAGPRG